MCLGSSDPLRLPLPDGDPLLLSNAGQHLDQNNEPLALENTFEYDKLGQLTSATGAFGNETYTYDTAGNLLTRTSGATSAQYTYDNPSWGDLLTAYQGQRIAYEGQSYDAENNTVTGTVVSGNPVSYYNGNRWDMEWIRGRLLSQATSDDISVAYTYDKNNLRSSKTVNGVEYSYTYAGDKLMRQSWAGNELYFFYDASGNPTALWYEPENGSTVVGYYMLDQQGDVVRMEDANGNVLASYSYDPWGKIISATGSLAEINPLRYRGYVYDQETGFYYLQSRYYDPAISRFLNADGYAVTGEGDVLGYNMFAYCNNDPVNKNDTDGSRPVEMDEDPNRRLVATIRPERPNNQTQVSRISQIAVGLAEDIINFDVNNQSEEKVLASNYFSIYKGVPVVRVDGNRSGSFGVIALTRETYKRPNPADIVRHEYGHVVQMKQLGVIKYAIDIFLPSALEYGGGDYYSRPWEITADIYGGVQSRKHSIEDIESVISQ